MTDRTWNTLWIAYAEERRAAAGVNPRGRPRARPWAAPAQPVGGLTTKLSAAPVMSE